MHMTLYAIDLLTNDWYFYELVGESQSDHE